MGFHVDWWYNVTWFCLLFKMSKLYRAVDLQASIMVFSTFAGLHILVMEYKFSRCLPTSLYKYLCIRLYRAGDCSSYVQLVHMLLVFNNFVSCNFMFHKADCIKKVRLGNTQINIWLLIDCWLTLWDLCHYYYTSLSICQLGYVVTIPNIVVEITITI